jgi:hypothetical protein
MNEYPYDKMSVGHARMVWLTILGSGWIDEDVLVNEPYNSVLDIASQVLESENLVEYDPSALKVRLKCKS